MVIIFLGPPGCGKGTQSAIISDALSLPAFSTSAALKEVAASDNVLGDQLRSLMNSGQLVPSTLVNEIVAQVLSGDKYRDGCILDGYPRTIDQAEFLDLRLKGSEVLAINFEISYDDLVVRITNRFVCDGCGAIYNKILSPTKIEGKCDFCESNSFSFRDDDNIDILRKRWEVYVSQSVPLIEYYASRGALMSIDATLEKQEVTNKLVEKLKKR
ncbi:MAG: hypothetical protein RLZZ59_306 [Pseudomonadota bacterium]